ncbi:MAG: RNA polymerase sigma-70 factor (ECF subfamily) [Alteromonadaceae bacterium]|jgi:RNA polymerase sigma-70 factor (ECF subfamily)
MLKMEPELITETNENSNDEKLSPPITMEAFLADIEKRAYHMAAFATGSHADALDLLQDSMIKLVTKYQEKPANEWKPLFYKILQNRIRDWHRHQKVKNVLFFWKNDDKDDWLPVQDADFNLDTPEKNISKTQQQQAALMNLKALSGKQQQCFLLRSWEGLSVAETSDVMGCSQGSVKTHYFRAVTKLRAMMGDEHEITF